MINNVAKNKAECQMKKMPITAKIIVDRVSGSKKWKMNNTAKVHSIFYSGGKNEFGTYG